MRIANSIYTSALSIIFFGLASSFPHVKAECPTCPSIIDDCFELTNQTSGTCFYHAPHYRFGFECIYWLTGEIDAPNPTPTNESSVGVPATSSFCPSTVPLTERGCSFYTIGGVHD